MGQAEARARPGATPTARSGFRQGRARSMLCGKGAQSLAQSMQQQMGQGKGQGRGRFGEARKATTTPIHASAARCAAANTQRRPPRSRCPGDIDVQRARRILEELRKRFGEFYPARKEELDYLCSGC